MLDRCNLLLSYAMIGSQRSLQKIWLPLSSCARILIDSGAFTNYNNRLKRAKGARSSKRDVELDDYITACKAFDGHVWQYIALDVIRNPDASQRNLQAMLDAGLRPMPVFVETDPPDFTQMERFMSISEYVCVAGGVRSNAHYAHYRYQQAFKASGERAKIHALGYMRWPTLFQLPLHSCDSSTFATGSQYGWLCFYDRRTGVARRHWKRLTNWRTDPVARQMLTVMRRCQVPYDVLSSPAHYRGMRGLTVLVSVLGYLNFMRHAAEYGVHLFLACSTITWVDAVAAVWATWDGQYFDYPASLAFQRELQSLRLTHWPSYEAKLVSALERRPVCAPPSKSL